jgi:hypothetical protein
VVRVLLILELGVILLIVNSYSSLPKSDNFALLLPTVLRAWWGFFLPGKLTNDHSSSVH